jgi:hypothetical protein
VLHHKYAHVKLIVWVEEALRFADENSFANAVAFALAFPPPKTFYRCITFALHLNGSRPLLNGEFRGGLEPVKTIEISMKFGRAKHSEKKYLSFRCIRTISQISEPLSVVI